ncbi:MAG: hypothetical protein AAF442_06245 [Pseudomonadota bacterium]
MNKIRKTYEEGLQEGRIEAMKSTLDRHDLRLTDHARRLQILERLFWACVGIVAFVQVWPDLQRFLLGD